MSHINLNEFLNELVNTNWASMNQPNMALKEDKLVLTYDLPGATKEHITVDTEDSIVIVKGIGGRYKTFTNTVRINPDYNMQTTEATLRDGVLTITIDYGKKTNRTNVTIK